ncbi:GYD domain-containing protein [Hyphomicrobium sp.]|uniref:GYD domain-containing protein n=2 Tax=Hyphomicrobium sp. TaxID=82 RepID=UPI0025C6299A|nr:GYD domain-containing protein [Hyphomicrobium sp.]
MHELMRGVNCPPDNTLSNKVLTMATFIMLTRLSHQALRSPSSLESLSHEVMERIRADCKGVAWKASYVVLGPADYLDIFTAPDIEMATKVATIIRTFGHATTEVWGATEWEKFTELVRYLPPAPVAAISPN